MSRVAVVGAGLAGLSAASALVADGHDVVVLEREAVPGGRAGVLEQDGFTFDTGPTVLTMPHLLDRAFARLGADRAQELRLRRLDPAYRAVYSDGSELRVRAELDDQVAELRRSGLEADARAFPGFVAWLEALYEAEMPHFIERNLGSPLDLVTRPMAAARLLRLGGFGRLENAVRRRISDPRLVRLLTFQAMYAGLAPRQALAIYAVITYMDCIRGVYFPEEGGMHGVPVALARVLERAGADLRYEAPVTELITDASGRLAGVTAAGERIAADAVVVTADLPTAYRQFLPGLTPPRALTDAQWSPSALVWHVGVRGTPGPSVAHHNIHFADAWEASFEQLITRKERMADASRLVTVPSLHAPGAAPPGHSALYVLEPVPHLGGRIDWAKEAGPARERLHAFLIAHGYPGDVVTERLVTPADWAAEGLAMGTPFSLAHTFFQTGPFRPANVEPRVPGVFFAGSGTTPGVGVPMVLVSGELAAERVRVYLGGRA
ncbi:MAG: phytoene desaturase family protein [Propionicimonas sp.]|uniref:phytoene desaturase family protein n=1 Tax=Propionicimonas sp. TaxID=1955623 RepID=UPI003D0ABEBD